jgi:small subunit ribosomal protein S7
VRTNTFEERASTDDLTLLVKEGSNVPRKGHTEKREVLADPVYNDVVVTKLINNIMLDGKRGVAQKIVYGAFEKVEEKTGKPALEAFRTAMNNVMPVLEVKAKRVGGATYQVPMEVKPERRQTLGLRWLTSFSRNRGEKTMVDKLAGEIMDAMNSTGGAVKRKEEMHRMADANKAFAHYRF